MEIEYLKKLADNALQLAVDEIRKFGNLQPKFLLALTRGENAIEIIELDGPFPEQQEARERILKIIRLRIAAGEVQAVVFATDVLIGKQKAVAVMIYSPMLRCILRQDYSRVGKAIDLEELHTNDDPAICSQMMGDLFSGGSFSRESESKFRLLTVSVKEEEDIRQSKIPKDVSVTVVSRGSEGRISARCKTCSVPMVTVERNPLLWFKCPQCGRMTFAVLANLRRHLGYAERHGGTFEFDLCFLDEASMRMMPPPDMDDHPDQPSFFTLGPSWRSM
jgi:predicted RNA-binding Zn-ribbon protein involved in translation (DUF1610 family)